MYCQSTPAKPVVSVQPLLENNIRQIAVSTTLRRICLPNVCIVFIPDRGFGRLPGVMEFLMNLRKPRT